MLKPTGGSASLFGELVALDGAELRRRIGYVAGEVRLYERETGRWHIDYLSGLRGATPSSDKDLCERLEFDPSRSVRQLSKGNKQKLALVLGLMHDPELLMLDEPTSGLDPLNQQAVFEVLGERISAGATVFLSSHILSEVEKVCQRVGILHAGRLIADEAMEDLLQKRIRHVDVTFAQVVPDGLLDGVTGVSDIAHLGPEQLRATVVGDAVGEVLRRIAAYDVRDVGIERASLEDVFLRFYRGEAGEGSAAPDHADREGGETS
jgi:ABC-2 type transport system ATP-binding protein